jgi:hypothetical protein
MIFPLKHSLCVGWRNLFPVVSILVLAGNRFWFYILLIYLCTGFSQNLLAVHKWIHKWIHRAIPIPVSSVT